MLTRRNFFRRIGAAAGITALPALPVSSNPVYQSRFGNLALVPDIIARHVRVSTDLADPVNREYQTKLLRDARALID